MRALVDDTGVWARRVGVANPAPPSKGQHKVRGGHGVEQEGEWISATKSISPKRGVDRFTCGDDFQLPHLCMLKYCGHIFVHVHIDL